VSAAGINIDGYSEMNGVVHVLAPDLEAARRCLSDAGFRIIQQQQVAIIPVADHRRSSARVSSDCERTHQRALQLSRTGNRLVIASDNPRAVLDRYRVALRTLGTACDRRAFPAGSPESLPSRRSPRSPAA
jgi:hypothetical protein